MTTEIQTFVSPDEIRGLRLLCACGTAITMPLTEDAKTRLPAEIQCPSCPKKWFEGTTDPRRMALHGFMSRILELQEFKKTYDRSVSLEIKTPNAHGASRDSGDGT